jgi:hypothetical protein
MMKWRRQNGWVLPLLSELSSRDDDGSIRTSVMGNHFKLAFGYLGYFLKSVEKFSE